MTESPVALQEKIDELEYQIAQAREALAIKREERKNEVVSLVREVIADNGYELEEIVNLLKPQKTVAARAKKPRTYYRDRATGKVYKGSRLPEWLETALAESGLELPDYKEQRMEVVE